MHHVTGPTGGQRNGHPRSVGGLPTEEISMLKKLAVAALAAGALVAVRKRSGVPGDADLWAEATRGPDSVSTPRTTGTTPG